MAVTFVIVCSRCGNLLLAKADQKTRTCPHCNFSIFVEKAKKLASANTANEASEILRSLKNDAGTIRKGLDTH
jgi:DNA-directed RNA polymerase subunit RPC12/RpoP